MADKLEESLEAAIRRGYRITLSRDPSAEELAQALAFLEARRELAPAETRAAVDRQGLIDLAQVLFSLNEFIYVE